MLFFFVIIEIIYIIQGMLLKCVGVSLILPHEKQNTIIHSIDNGLKPVR